MQELAVLYRERNAYVKAEPLLLKAVEGQRIKLGDTHPCSIESWNNLIELYKSWGKPEKAEEWRAKLLQTKATEIVTSYLFQKLKNTLFFR
jgi:hypothetical protein